MGTSGFDRGRRGKVAGRGATALVKPVAKNNWRKRASFRSLIKAVTFTLTSPRWVGDGRRKVGVR